MTDTKRATAKKAATRQTSEKAEKGLLRLVDSPDAKHKAFAGTTSEAFNTVTLNQAFNSVWLGASPDPETYNMLVGSAAGAMMNIAPKDAIEGMLAAQMVATHNASMECFRRAMLPEQPMQGREMNLAQANKLTRSYTTLVHALDKHRGKGQQTVRVEHVNVYDGGQAIVGNVGADERGSSSSSTAPAALTQCADQPFDVASLATRGEFVKHDA
ncbi:hypothetical protein U0C82_18545 [Fulvimarina sp. 2208YS6-2-32]|uniref:DUF305 domain-containing protein n=1 Tax=Fulvimarina uroteuthidis TaxID=3098149 RepID=A0ABU5I6W6_9HYPH|nr:hypothetical protein [Fulvimarina sp. 2208YS6-2-32]MDY8111124.1 hypothetical protein [Fulvimarina sp. 2208YS6-2-32]